MRKPGGRPLDAGKLDDMAVRYVARYATTAAKLRQYLERKVRERGWSGTSGPDIGALADRLVELGYIDDRAFAMSRASAHAARGLGARRLVQALRGAGVAAEDGQDAIDAATNSAVESAVRFARRRRLGPFATTRAQTPRERERAIGAFVRAGHDAALARALVALDPIPEADAESIARTLSHTRR